MPKVPEDTIEELEREVKMLERTIHIQEDMMEGVVQAHANGKILGISRDLDTAVEVMRIALAVREKPG